MQVRARMTEVFRLPRALDWAHCEISTKDGKMENSTLLGKTSAGSRNASEIEAECKSKRSCAEHGKGKLTATSRGSLTEGGEDMSVGDLQSLVREQGRKLEMLFDIWVKRPDVTGNSGGDQESGAALDGMLTEGMPEQSASK